MALGKEMCASFETCATQNDSTANEFIIFAFSDLKEWLESGECNSAEEVVQFEVRLEREPGLAHLVAEHHALDVLARRVAPREPADFEWKRLQSDPLFRSSVGLGWGLVIAAAAISLVLVIWGVTTNESLSVLERGLILGSLAGFALLFLSVLWRRLRTYPLDPYRHVER